MKVALRLVKQKNKTIPDNPILSMQAIRVMFIVVHYSNKPIKLLY